jgi:hypothetical protein
MSLPIYESRRSKIETYCTLLKKNFLIYKEIQNGAVAMSYIRKGFLIYEERLCNRSLLDFLIYEEFFFSLFLSVYTCTEGQKRRRRLRDLALLLRIRRDFVREAKSVLQSVYSVVAASKQDV